jgi:Spy/CpxP family protein refolding chaperone
MKSSLTIWLLLGALAASAGLNVYHAVRSAGAGDARDVCPIATRPACRLVEQLALSESQRQKLFGCCGGRCGRESEERGRRIRELTADLERELNGQAIDRERVAGLADELAGLRAEEWKFRLQCIMQVRETLTPAQRERLIAAAENP